MPKTKNQEPDCQKAVSRLAQFSRQSAMDGGAGQYGSPLSNTFAFT